MPNTSKYTLGFLPATYWNVPESVYANIKGEIRRRQIRQARAEGTLENLPDSILKDSLTNVVRKAASRIHPSYLGGEFLPDYLPGELEIARVSLENVTNDVISIRAQPEGRLIHYRVVDEYETEFTFGVGYSTAPLRLGELICAIDDTEGPGGNCGLTSIWRNHNLKGTDDPESLVDFVTVTSEFYPELEQWYDEEAREWLQDVLSEAE